jgi:assimilatory nitrate reductase catalytic subunit
MAAPAPVRTTCPYCGVGCGVLASPDGQGGAQIAGDPEHPSNFGRLCSKGSALGETLGLSTRLLHPEIGGRRTSWDQALDHVAHEFSRIRAAHGPGAIAFYLSGQLLTEDYYVANKLAKGFIGTPHVDTNSRLCMASSVAGHRRTFGADVVPQCYDDLELADLVVLAGSNAAWCHPILYQRIQLARAERGVRVVVIDPRRTATCEGADLHLPLAPGTDAALWNGLLAWLAAHGRLDWRFIGDHTESFGAALAEARSEAGTIAEVAIETGLNGSDIETFYTWWSDTARVVSCYSQGVNQSAQGTDKVNAILNCHLATGRIGKPGSGPLSLTGQPNAMGGREVGGLANMLAAHMGFAPEERDRVRRFWGAPNLVAREGLKAVQMFEAIARGDIKALWVMGTNPAVSLPDADRVRAALGRLELLVVSENVAANDTLPPAHVRLPAAAWGEKDGTVTNSERRISRQRPFLPLPGEARPDWAILAEVGRRLGWADAFAYTRPADIFREHARLSGFENDGARVFDISALADLGDDEYEALAPVQWPCPKNGAPAERVFANGGFATPSGRARFVKTAPPRLAATPSAKYPFVLNTGRVRDQWHTMTRTGLSPRLSVHVAEPFVEIHPRDAAELGFAQGTLARVSTRYGAAVLRVMLSEGQQRGSLFVPIHWSAQNSSAGRVCALVQPATDSVSGQPEAKATPAAIAPESVSHYGFLLTRASPAPVAGLAYWARAAMPAGSVTFLALDLPAGGWTQVRDSLLPAGERTCYEDARSGLYRAAVLREERLEAVLYLAPGPTLPSLEWLKGQFARDAIPPAERRALLAGRALDGAADEGPIVCVCHQIGRKRIEAAIAAGAETADAIGDGTRAGTNCGSCVPELRRLLGVCRPAATADAAE